MVARNSSHIPTDRSNMFYWQVDRPFTDMEADQIFLHRFDSYDRALAHKAVAYGMQKFGKSSTDAQVISSEEIRVFGSVNIVLKAVLFDGTSVIYRQHPQKAKNGYFWVEKVATELARAAMVPTYQTYYVDDTQKEFPFDFMLMECLPGVNIRTQWPLDKSLEQSLITQTGSLLARIHSVKTTQFGFFDNVLAKSQGVLQGIHSEWTDHIYASLEANVEYLANTNTISAQDVKRIMSVFEKNKSFITCTNPTIVHNDLADWNELSVRDKVTGILDWDECYSGDPIADFAAWNVFFPAERMQYLIAGYTQISSLPENFDEKFHLYRLRYCLSKAVLRKRKFDFLKDQQMEHLLGFALDAIQSELHIITR